MNRDETYRQLRRVIAGLEMRPAHRRALALELLDRVEAVPGFSWPEEEAPAPPPGPCTCVHPRDRHGIAATLAG